MTWTEYQKSIAAWSLTNFGENPAWRPVLGLVEECGEFWAACDAQIPPLDQLAAMTDAIGDQTVYVLALCEEIGLPFQSIVDEPRNQPGMFAARELIGALGVVSRAILKSAQGIRGYDETKTREHVFVGLSIWFRWATHCALKVRKWDPAITGEQALGLILEEVWSKVQQRNWKDNPADADKVQQRGA